ncbi:MAG: 4-alpha-glucanotransferase [Clostridia bacterium]|nr:4-alpha-glucanotransferase [Clostridia bacterium]
MQRALGIMLHISSLPNKYGYGAFSKEAFCFVDFLNKSNVKYWQVLPLNPIMQSGSPFQSYSVFAGNSCFIDFEQFLSKEQLKKCGFKNSKKMDFDQINLSRKTALKIVFKKYFNENEIKDFCNKNSFWLDDYATFMAIKDVYKGVALQNFVNLLKVRDKTRLQKFKSEHKKIIDFYKFEQYLFFEQWNKLKEYANKNGVKIIGDLAFYPSTDSCDVWANRNDFCVDYNLQPKKLGGVPPDYFSKEGQIWGNPVYNIENMKADNYKWWQQRLEQTKQFFDVVRLDHFRGFDAFYEVDATKKDAKNGVWQKSFGDDLFGVLNKTKVPLFIAEDLGVITESVRQLMAKYNIPGMRVFQFAFDGNEKNLYFPHNYTDNCVCYLGTHDNNTFIGFLKEIPPQVLQTLKDYLRLPLESTYEQITKQSIKVLACSKANLCVLCMQDLLLLDEKSRMNIPGVAFKNWGFKITQKDLSPSLQQYIKQLTIISDRV